MEWILYQKKIDSKGVGNSAKFTFRKALILNPILNAAFTKVTAVALLAKPTYNENYESSSTFHIKIALRERVRYIFWYFLYPFFFSKNWTIFLVRVEFTS